MRYLLVLSLAFMLGACSKPENPTFKKLENISFNSLSIQKPYSVKLNADAIFPVSYTHLTLPTKA